jgi:hypothetical protein
MKQTNVMRAKEFRQAASASRSGCESSKKAIGVERLRDAPAECLARGTRLMIHERKLSKKLVIDGPLTTSVAVVKATLNEIECSIAIQNEGFQNLVLGSSVTPDEVLKKAPSIGTLKLKRRKALV